DSWAHAYKYLQDGLVRTDQINPNDGTVIEVWVANGVTSAGYLPDENAANTTGTNDRGVSFDLRNNVRIYGGFQGLSCPSPSGGETLLKQRNPYLSLTILNGEIGNSGDSDNSYHVVKASSG